MRKLFHFLGSVYFALCILAGASLIVVLGTFLESYSGSHLFAAKMTYNNPVFEALLSMMFVNILFASLRRWPFRKRHIPFLLTHLGLLMILAGCLVKACFGIQGQMLIVEGSGTSQIIIPNTYAISLEDREGRTSVYPVGKKGRLPSNDWIQVLAFYPHHESSFKVIPADIPDWRIVKVQDGDFDKIVRDQILKQVSVKLTDRKNGKVEKAKNLRFDQDSLIVSDKWEIPLSGPLSLMTLNYGNPLQGSPSLIAEVEHPPTAFIGRGLKGEWRILTIDNKGHIKSEELSKLAVYDKGFGGYSLQSSLSRVPDSEGALQKDKRHKELLRQILKESGSLIPPLELIRSGCLFKDFSGVCVDFLTDWDLSNQWIYEEETPLSSSLKEVLTKMNWDIIPKEQLKSSYFASLLLSRWDGHSFEKPPWKYLISESRPESTYDQTIIEQLFLIPNELPDIPDIDSLPFWEKARILTVLLRAYGVHLKSLVPPSEREESFPFFEFPLEKSFKPLPPSQKPEENAPLIVLHFKGGETVSVGYDKQGSGLKWPVLKGNRLIHFGPEIKTLPYHIRLRNAREIPYPDTNRPYSFESDIIVSGKNMDPQEVTLKMNYVYETWDGTRFYLAGIHSLDETRAKKVQIIVNHDPARYRLTYPGGIILALGIILLGIFRFNFHS